jgi:hypothetical protein
VSTAAEAASARAQELTDQLYATDRKRIHAELASAQADERQALMAEKAAKEGAATAYSESIPELEAATEAVLQEMENWVTAVDRLLDAREASKQCLRAARRLGVKDLQPLPASLAVRSTRDPELRHLLFKIRTTGASAL